MAAIAATNMSSILHDSVQALAGDGLGHGVPLGQAGLLKKYLTGPNARCGEGSLTGSVSPEGGNTAATDSVEQVSPTLPRSTKHRVSGKLRRSASAISKSSN
ncbi:hypothetical protein ILYODFUR_005179 [Ilyodon furcidens]|uniref:Uncharacterized protein n=1 Tax=Ilyodon furcidens TaxID=33524 RepID=A0ABV0SUC5_9TELE